MDFQQLMSLASQNQKKAEKKLPSTKKYSTQVSAPKKLPKARVESDTLKKLRKAKEAEKLEKERNEINDHITERIKEQKRREDALRIKKKERMHSKVHHDREKGKVQMDKQIERAKERRENIDEKNLTPKMREKLKEERLREKLREIKLKDKQEIQQTTERMITVESKKESFKIPKGNSDIPKSVIPNEKSSKSSTAIVSAGARPLYKIVSNQSDNSSKSEAKKTVTKVPPPLDFNSLMKIASQKASSSKAPTATPISTPISKNLLGRPMTQEEKERHQRMTSKQFKEWYKYGTSPPRPESPTEDVKKETKYDGDKVRKKESMDSNRKDKRPAESSLEKKRPSSTNGDSKKRPSSSDQKVSSKSKTDDLADKYKMLELKYKALEEKLKQQSTGSTKEKSQKSSSSSSSSSSSNQPSNSQNKKISSKSSGKYTVENNNLLICRPTDKAPEKPKSTWDRIYDQIQKSDPIKKPVKRKRVIDSDEDEDLDGFIDDEPLEDEYSSNYSKCIREIFGYDRRKFQYDDEDDDDMETSFAQQMKEEIRSTKIGILEDLEDIRLEKEQKKKKAKLKPGVD